MNQATRPQSIIEELSEYPEKKDFLAPDPLTIPEGKETVGHSLLFGKKEFLISNYC